MKKCLACLMLIISVPLYSQEIPSNPNVVDSKGLRQGQWTVLFNKKLEQVTNKDSAAFYRTLQYVNDKPAGEVKDYYRSGALRWQGTLLSDKPSDAIDFRSP